jgi:hypothetical protein
MLTPQLLAFFFSTEIMMNSSVVLRLLAMTLSLFLAQAVTQIGNDSVLLRGRSETPPLASILHIENDSHLRGSSNHHAPTTITASVIQIENDSHLRGGSQSPTLVSPQSHDSSPHLRTSDSNTTTGSAFNLVTTQSRRLRRTEL